MRRQTTRNQPVSKYPPPVATSQGVRNSAHIPASFSGILNCSEIAGLPLLDLPQIGCETEIIRGDNMHENDGKIITVGVTGASGAVLAQKMLMLLDSDARVARLHLVVTETGLRLFAEELRITPGNPDQ